MTERRSVVIDVGMGLGADTRYYLAQGFSVVAVEANPNAIELATADKWLTPFIQTEQLKVVHAGVVAASKKGKPMEIYTLNWRPEQSRSVPLGDSSALPVPTVDCADLLQSAGGHIVYMKIDIEEQTVDCIESI